MYVIKCQFWYCVYLISSNLGGLGNACMHACIGRKKIRLQIEMLMLHSSYHEKKNWKDYRINLILPWSLMWSFQDSPVVTEKIKWDGCLVSLEKLKKFLVLPWGEVHKPETVSLPRWHQSMLLILVVPMNLGLQLFPHAAEALSYLQIRIQW